MITKTIVNKVLVDLTLLKPTSVFSRFFCKVSKQSRSRKMSSVKDVDQQKFVVGFADFLKKSGKMKVPEWADLIKLSRFNEQGPHNPDW